MQIFAASPARPCLMVPFAGNGCFIDRLPLKKKLLDQFSESGWEAGLIINEPANYLAVYPKGAVTWPK